MNKYIKTIGKCVVAKYGKDRASEILKTTNKEYDRLLAVNKDEIKPVKAHTVKIIYPIISLYRGLTLNGVDNKEAFDLLDKEYSHMAEGKAKAMRMMCKLPGMYKKMPKIFHSVTIKSFGIKQGFEYKFYETEPTRCKFDMTKCLYCDVCKANDCMELVPIFCHADDVTDGNIHEKLVWNRTKIMGDGGDVCDFDLYVDENRNS